MCTLKRPQTREERQRLYNHICHDGDLDAVPLPPCIVDRWSELDRSDGVCDPVPGAELDALRNPFPTIFTTRQTTGMRMLATLWTNDDVLEYKGLGEGCKRFGS